MELFRNEVLARFSRSRAGPLHRSRRSAAACSSIAPADKSEFCHSRMVARGVGERRMAGGYEFARRRHASIRA
jgi:hypothetical protein